VHNVLSEISMKICTSINDNHKEGSIRTAMKERECRTDGEPYPVRVAVLAFRVRPHCLLSVQINVPYIDVVLYRVVLIL
jgi:hypothetical protein